MKLYNTLTKQKEELIPLNPGKEIGIYHCGPTVYWDQHIGNMRAVVIADFLVRSLKYHKLESKLVRNYTDVGHLTGDNEGDADAGIDRMAKAAEREKKDPLAIAEKYIAHYEKDRALLNTFAADVTPRATEHIKEMIAMVEILIEKGFAYTTPLAVYFEVSKKEDYTKLSGQDLSQNITSAGHGEISDADKRSPFDFALWFFKAGAHAQALQTWPSPFTSDLVVNGEGFPGWHIECSAMAHKYLGETFDIHMGGIEHIPIHHTNEIAQSESAWGVPLSHLWLHNEHLLVDGKKMSKSEGTSYLVSDIINRGYSAFDLRYFFLQAHYRSKQNFTWEALSASRSALANIYSRVLELQEQSAHEVGSPDEKLLKEFGDKLADDINLPQALGVFHQTLKSDLPAAVILATVYQMDNVLGLDIMYYHKEALDVPDAVHRLLEERDKARTKKDWKRSDELRDEIFAQGYKVSDKGHEQVLEKL